MKPDDGRDKVNFRSQNGCYNCKYVYFEADTLYGFHCSKFQYPNGVSESDICDLWELEAK